MLFLAGLALTVIALGLALYLVRTRESKSLPPVAGLQSDPSHRQSARTPLDAGALPGEDEQRKAMVQFLAGIADGMKKAGIPEMPSVAESLRSAVESNDHGEIVRAFHEAIYGRWQKMNEVLPAIRSYLRHPDPFVRYTAARSLYTAGDRSGYETLIEMVNADQAILEGSQDLRVEAAQILAKFREREAASAIIALYGKSKAGGLLSSLATLGVRTPEAVRFPFVPSDLAITEYAKIGAVEFLPQIAATFQHSTDSQIKNAAAWALARSGRVDYANYLAQAAQAAINANPRGSQKFDSSTEALRYLGSLQLPVAKQTLERALYSKNPVAVQYAVVNLLFNQPGESEKVKQVVLRELRGEQRKLGAELLLNIASKLDDPEIRAAGHAFDQRSGGRSWKLYAVERRQWPIYNWIDDYAVALNQ